MHGSGEPHVRHPRFSGRPVRELLDLAREMPHGADLPPAGGVEAGPADPAERASGDAARPRPAGGVALQPAAGASGR
jgi:hypothetical protein